MIIPFFSCKQTSCNFWIWWEIQANISYYGTYCIGHNSVISYNKNEFDN